MGWAGVTRAAPPFPQIGRTVGQKKDPEEQAKRLAIYPNLTAPTRLAALAGIRIAFVAAGPGATHCMVGTTEGALYTWGRNEKGQCGHGDLKQASARCHPSLQRCSGAPARAHIPPTQPPSLQSFCQPASKQRCRWPGTA